MKKVQTDYPLEDFLVAGASKPIKEAFRYGLSNKDQEAFGLFVYQDQRSSYNFITFSNLNSANPHEFTASNKDFYTHYLSGDIIALFHTHLTDHAEPSNIDKALSNALGLPTFILSTLNKTTHLYYPTSYKPQPLTERIFIPFFQDCISYVCDFYYENLNINLNQYVYNWSRPKKDYNHFLLKEIDHLFYEVPFKELQYGDLVVFDTSELTYHHLGVIDHDNQFSHHPIGMFPRTELFNTIAQNKVYKLYRYKDQ